LNNTRNTTMQESYIVFEVAGASYAAPSAQVVMLEMVDTITRVPNAPEFVEGVAAVRGQIIPVISVRRRFHVQPIPLDIRARLVVIRLGERQVGMLVDTAREFVRISSDQIHLAGDLTGPGVEYLDGVATLPSRLILLVNLERLLSFEDRQTLAARDSDLLPIEKPKDSEKNASPVDAAARKRSRKG
jgi:purine-binding chemotaxis protein CheW